MGKTGLFAALARDADHGAPYVLRGRPAFTRTLRAAGVFRAAPRLQHVKPPVRVFNRMVGKRRTEWTRREP
jgi:hypothetical protein